MAEREPSERILWCAFPDNLQRPISVTGLVGVDYIDTIKKKIYAFAPKCTDAYYNPSDQRTPVDFAMRQCVSLTPLAAEGLPSIGLFYTRREFDDVVTKLCCYSDPVVQYQIERDARDYIFDLTNGHPGPVKSIVPYIFSVYFSWFIESPRRSNNIRNDVKQGPEEIETEAPSSNVAKQQVSPDNPVAIHALEHPASDTKEPQPAQDAEKSQEKPSDAPKERDRVSSASATAATDMTSTPATAAPVSEPDKVSSITTIIALPPPEQAVPSVAQPANSSPASPPSAPAQPTASDTAAPPPSHDIDPWTRAYEIFQNRQPELMADYKKHLASLQDDVVASADLSTPRSVESIVKQLLEDREKKQWRVSLLGKNIKIREQAERLTKFLLWSDPIVKNAVSAQPYAALAWSGVSLLLPCHALKSRLKSRDGSTCQLRKRLAQATQHSLLTDAGACLTHSW
ncbi:hypothetical protein DPV78_000940 [Talaromyces pinophilus]|nr:hypothetical protein DPV78_000940 [Talaromyces pinophilus]